MPIKGLIDKKTKYKNLAKNRTVLYVTVVSFWYSRSSDDVCWFFFLLQQLCYSQFHQRFACFSQNSAYRKAWFKTKLLFKERNRTYLKVNKSNMLESFLKCNYLIDPKVLEEMKHGYTVNAWITKLARWANISAYKMYFPTNLYLGQPSR